MPPEDEPQKSQPASQDSFTFNDVKQDISDGGVGQIGKNQATVNNQFGKGAEPIPIFDALREALKQVEAGNVPTAEETSTNLMALEAKLADLPGVEPAEVLESDVKTVESLAPLALLNTLESESQKADTDRSPSLLQACLDGLKKHGPLAANLIANAGETLLTSMTSTPTLVSVGLSLIKTAKNHFEKTKQSQ